MKAIKESTIFTYNSRSEYNERGSLEDIFKLTLDNLLIEMRLENGLYVKQRQNVDATVEIAGKPVHMYPGIVYLTDGFNVLKTLQYYENFIEWIDKYNKIGVEGLSKLLKGE